MNPWAWTGRNPYYETAFQVLDLDPTADRAAARTRISARRKRISYDASRFPLFGTPLSVAQINAAEEQLTTASTRLAAELLTHRPEPEGVDLAALTELLELSRALAAASATASPSDAAPQPNTDWLELGALPALVPDPIAPAPSAEEPTA
ncbi:hypothetical protein HLB23_20590 [Nocardia uniformis]|uniref:Uncharacterized protein n=1 Tax=Nocardia uniformis TaxID=53432 RepID=A0A849C8L3_9NOCA|nr:hypothetical protein [Nocardia uniformis]NNH72227.1 hypothetical protein [Nocardia uniformis]